MAVRGATAKEEVKKKILETFQGAFVNGKEIRIPAYDNGELIQIKVTLVAATKNVECDGDIALPSPTTAAVIEDSNIVQAKVDMTAPDEDEMQSLKNVIERLGL